MFYNFRRITRYLVIFTLVIVMSIAPVFATPVSDTATHNLLSNIYDKVETIRSYVATLINYFSPLSGDNLTISQQLLQIRNLISAVGNQTSDVSSKLITTNNYLSSISSNTVNYTQYIDEIENQLKYINWNQATVTFGIYSSLSDAANQTNAINSNGIYNPVYLRVNFNIDIFSNAIKIQYPLVPIYPIQSVNQSSYISNIYALRNDNVTIVPLQYNDVHIYFSDLTHSQSFYLYGVGRTLAGGATDVSRRSFIFEFSGDGTYLYSGNQCYGYYLDFNSEDYIKLSNYLKIQDIDTNQIESYLKALKDLYASDDLIAAKQQQQNFEDQVIDDFTGSGSAAASGSDATSLKNISGSLKSGLNSGGSISNALGVFNDSSDLWKWFSQDNYNDINGQPTRSDNGIIDFYNINQEQLQELLHNEYR